MKKIYFFRSSVLLAVLLIGCTNKETQTRLDNESQEELEGTDELSLEERAEAGDAEAQFMMGADYDYGDNAGNYEEAVKWYRKSADQGNAWAQNNLGFCYQEGNGVEQSYEEAMKWYLMAAGQNHSSAENAIGFFYAKGYGVVANKEEAVKWYKKAAEHGSHVAQYNLALCYLEGNGVEQSRNEAVKWLRKAAEEGYEKAINKLQEMGE